VASAKSNEKSIQRKIMELQKKVFLIAEEDGGDVAFYAINAALVCLVIDTVPPQMRDDFLADFIACYRETLDKSSIIIERKARGLQ
jgi:hypothetical protein